MTDERVGSLTQDELLAELHRHGYDDVSKRQIAEWRRKELLPPFDVIGGGRGRRLGRESSSWSDGALVFDQTLWVRELLPIFGSVEGVFLPLFVLGYPVPLRRVREVLGRPLNEIADGIAEAIENEARASGEIEDLVQDAAYHNVEEMRRKGAEALLMPQDSLEAFLNLFFNRGYDLNDSAFELGAEKLKEYERAMRQRCATALVDGGLGDVDLARRESSMASFFDRAPFIQRYFSHHQLKLAVDECTDDDLSAVQRDLCYLRGMALQLHKIISIITSELPAEYKPERADILWPVLTVGGLLVLADLSLRRNGFAEVIDCFLPVALREFQRGLAEEMERELVEVSKVIPEAIETYGTAVVNSLIQEVQDSRGM